MNHRPQSILRFPLRKPPPRQPRQPPRTTKRLFTHTTPHNILPPYTHRLFKLPHPPNAPSQHHHDLPTFQNYTARTALPQSSSTYIGTHYEYTVQGALRSAGLNLHRVGGRADAGIDLVGTWHLPGHLEHPVRVFVQCKALRAKAGPNLVRELEGAFRLPAGGGGGGGMQKIGVLVCPREATRGVREALARSGFPLVWLMVETDGRIKQALWNPRVEELGLGLLGVEVVYEEGKEGGRRIGFTWDGVEVPHMDHVEEDMLRVQEEWLRLWGDLDRSAREQLLDVVEELFPDEKPLLTGSGCSSLSEADRARVLEVLHSRMDRAKSHS